MSSPLSLPPDISRGYQYVVAQWSCVSVAVLVVLLRFCIRGMLRRKIGQDDYTILAALAFALVQSILAIFQVKEGFGRNIQYLRPTQVMNITRQVFVTILCTIIGTYLVRISICLFILQLLPFTERFSRWWTYGLMVFFSITTTGTFLEMCFQCIPIQGYWDRRINAHCISPAVTTKINQAQGVFAVIMDILCVLLPIMVFRKIQIGWRDKLALFALLALGLFIAGSAVARTVQYKFISDNPTWDIVPDAIWASLEQNIGIIVASMPALRQLSTIFNKQSPARRSLSFEKPFAGASSSITSPLDSLTEATRGDHIPSIKSPVSSTTESINRKREVDKEYNPSPIISIAHRKWRLSSIAEQQSRVEDHQDLTSREGSEA